MSATGEGTAAAHMVSALQAARQAGRSLAGVEMLVVSQQQASAFVPLE
jgi:hypothetical protein